MAPELADMATVRANQDERQFSVKRVACIVATIVAATSLISSGVRAATTLQGFGDMIVDASTGRIFVSSGKAGSSIVVFDQAGDPVKTISGVSGAAGMVLDDGKLYVGLRNAAGIDVIDTATLTKVDSISTPSPVSSETMVKAGGRLWFATGECSQWDAKLTAIDVASEVVVAYPGPTNGSFYCPMLAAAPKDPDSLLVWESGLSPASVYKYDVSGSEPVLAAQMRTDSSNMRDIAISADLSTFFTASGSPYEIVAYRYSDLAKSGSYPTGAYPSAVTISPDGTTLGAGRDAGYDPDVFKFTIGDSSPTYSSDFGSLGTLLPRALEFSPDGKKLYAVTAVHGEAPVFRLVGTVPASTTLSLSSSKSTITRSQAVTVVADLGSKKAVAGEKVSIYKTSYGGTRTLVKEGKVSRDGKISVTVSGLRKNTVFEAEYAGGPDHAASSSRSRLVKVRAVTKLEMQGHFGKSGKWKLYRYGDLPDAFAKVSPSNNAGGSIRFILQTNEGAGWVKVDTAEVPLQSSGAYGVVIGGGTPHDFRAKAIFSGNEQNAGDPSPWAYFRYR